ncbi:TPA: hypothetical protein DEP58_00560 [Patescibacteria group bacterium]|nr:MAG: hypothetical protein UU98_C0002G0019 [Parcubacteria group bacterium GW2011_GWD2_42_14]HCC04780.1 hypothetical protein [Patescibacteria group bacterium]
MNFFKKHQKHIAQTLLVLFLTSTVVLPALAPLTTFAQSGTGQSLAEATENGLDDGSYAPSTGCFQDGKLTTSSFAGCVAFMTYYVMALSYKIAGWMGLFFNFALNELVVGMGEVVRSMNAIMTAWKTIRDITNVFLVFLTVYIGIATILGISGFGAKQMLWKVVLAALLVNFSVTFTKVIIDISNLTAIQTVLMFQSEAAGTIPAECAERVRSTGAIENNNVVCISNGIASAFWTQLKITTIFDFSALKAGDPEGGDETSLYWTMTLTYLMATAMFIVLAFVFGGAGFLFIARFIILVFLLIVSPLALVLWITGVSGQGRAWWHSLINQSIFPPALLLCWWIAYVILRDYTNSYAGVTLGSVGTVSPSAISIATMFITVIGFLIAGLIVAKKLGAHGADAVLKTGEKWSRSVAIGAGSLAGAYTVGWASSRAQRKYAEDMAEANRMENGQYVHKSPMAKLKRGLSGGRIDRGLSTAVGAGAGMKFGGSSFAERKLSNKKNSDARIKELNETGRDTELKEATGIVNSKYYAENQKTAHDIAKRKIASASQAEIERLRENSGKAGDTPQMINAYSKKHASALAAKESATPMQRRQLTEAAFKKEREAIRTVNTTQDAETKKAYIKTLRDMSSSDIKENAVALAENPGAVAHMSHQTFKQIKENKDDMFDAPTVGTFIGTRKAHFESLTGDALKDEIRMTKPADLAEHDVSFLQRGEVVQNIDPQTLTGMVKVGLSQEKREAMKVAVEKEYAKIKIPTESSKIIDPKTGQPVKTSENLTPEQQNIVKLHNWFNDTNKMSV